MPFEINLSELFYFLILGMTTFFIGLIGTMVFIRAMHKWAILAIPNERSMHTQPTTTGVGWVIVLVTIAIYLVSHNPAVITTHWLIPTLMFLLALVSWFDDKNELPSILRFGMHIGAVSISLILLTDNSPIIWDAWPLWLDRAIAGLCWLWFINLFNFMDGIDGIVGTEIVTISLGLLTVGLIISLPLPTIELLVVLISVTLGFLWSNWHPAKVYLGDTGSIPLGFLLGWLLIQLAQQGYLIAALLLPAYFIADASYTLLRRILKGERFWRAHRSHLYQQATLAVKNPAIVVARIAAANLILIFAAVVSIRYSLAGFALGLVTVTVLLLHLHTLGRKK